MRIVTSFHPNLVVKVHTGQVKYEEVQQAFEVNDIPVNVTRKKLTLLLEIDGSKLGTKLLRRGASNNKKVYPKYAVQIKNTKSLS